MDKKKDIFFCQKSLSIYAVLVELQFIELLKIWGPLDLK